MNHLRFCVLVSLLAPYLGWAQESGTAQRFTLNEAVAYALDNNDSIKMARLDESIARLQVKETAAMGLPQVQATANMQYFFDIPTQLLPDFISPAVYGILVGEGVPIRSDPSSLDFTRMVPAQFGTNYNISGQIAVNQLIFNGEYIVGLRAANAVKELSATLRNTKEINIGANVAKLYLQVLALAETQDLLLKNKGELDKNLVELKALMTEGMAEQMDVDRLELTGQRIDNQLISVINAQILVKLLLKLQMGYPVEETIELADKIEDHLVMDASLLSAAADPQGRAEYRTLLVNKELQTLNKQRWQAGYLPSLSGFLSHSQNALVNEFELDDGDNWFPTTVGGFSLSVPVFDGLLKQSKIQQAKVELERTDLMIHQFEQAVTLEVERTKSAYSLAQKNYELEKKNLDLTQRIYERAQVMQAEGVGSSFETNTALIDLYTAQSAYLQANYKLITAQINLQKALGVYSNQ